MWGRKKIYKGINSLGIGLKTVYKPYIQWLKCFFVFYENNIHLIKNDFIFGEYECYDR